MTDRYSIRAYWGSRKEGMDVCADRLLDFFLKMESQVGIGCSWYQKGKSFRQALKLGVNVLERETLMKLLNSGVNRKDFSKEVIVDLGFHVALWNGKKEKEVASLSINCGSYCQTPGIGGNRVLFDLPEDLGSLSKSEQMLKLFTLILDVWEPERACVCSDDAAEDRNFNAKRPFVDWIVFVPGAFLEAKNFPQAFRVLPAHSGTIIVVEPEAPNSSSTAHQQKVREIEHRLNRVLKT